MYSIFSTHDTRSTRCYAPRFASLNCYESANRRRNIRCRKKRCRETDNVAGVGTVYPLLYPVNRSRMDHRRVIHVVATLESEPANESPRSLLVNQLVPHKPIIPSLSLIPAERVLCYGSSLSGLPGSKLSAGISSSYRVRR